MIRLGKYLKPYVWMILIAIALLFVQANCELALPDYLSKIVNIGLQQGGVESVVPTAVRQSQMEKMTLFLSEADQTTLLASYTLVDANSADYAQYVEEYPTLASEPIYVLNALDETQTGLLSPIVQKGMLIVSTIQQTVDNPEAAAQMGQKMGFDLSKIPAGMDLFTILGKLTPEQRSAMTQAVDQQYVALGESMTEQMAIAAVKKEYTILGVDSNKLQINYIIRMGGLMLLVTLGSAICTILVGYFSAKVAAGFGRDVRMDVFSRVESFSNSEFDKFSTASLITRTTNDVTQVQMVVMMMIRMIFYAPIIGVGGILRALNQDTSMWWIIAVAVGILLTMIAVIFTIALPKFKIVQSLIDRLNLVTRENLTGMMVIRAFNRQDFEVKRFDKANTDLTGTMMFINRITSFMFPGMTLIMNGLSLLIIWVGAHQVAESNLQVGDMMAFIQYAMQIVIAFLVLSMMFIFLPRATVSAGRVADVLDTEPVIKDPKDARPFSKPARATVEFRNVSFRYPGAEEDVLHDITFTAKPGEITALIGSTGSGKSTVVNLLPRFYDVTEGSILVNGVDVRQITQHDLHESIGYIPQKGTLFSGTIESNLRYADENASEAEVREAAEIAQAVEFIDTREGGMASEIAQGGGNVSGGQKQRLSIARALLKKPPIYIFDDSFSSLDFKTDAALRKALKQKTADSTLLIVTQRVSTVKNAEQIIVLEEGRIAGKGTHQELLESCETYREICLSQLGKEELS